jgi:hypothetical protein
VPAPPGRLSTLTRARQEVARAAHPVASMGEDGLHAQMNTSEVCPVSVVTADSGMVSGPPSGPGASSPGPALEPSPPAPLLPPPLLVPG